MIYKVFPTYEANRIMEWAEENEVDYDIWEPRSILDNEPTIELGLSRWPEIGYCACCAAFGVDGTITHSEECIW
jgi:hypothetical protein